MHSYTWFHRLSFSYTLLVGGGGSMDYFLLRAKIIFGGMPIWGKIVLFPSKLSNRFNENKNIVSNRRETVSLTVSPIWPLPISIPIRTCKLNCSLTLEMFTDPIKIQFKTDFVARIYVNNFPPKEFIQYSCLQPFWIWLSMYQDCEIWSLSHIVASCGESNFSFELEWI